MQSEEGTEAGKSCENGEAVSVGTPAAIEGSISQKYRDLKSKLKYLIYVSEPVLLGAFCCLLHGGEKWQ